MSKQTQTIVEGINDLCDKVLNNAGQLAVLEYRLQNSNLRQLTPEKAQELINVLMPVSRGAIFDLTISHEGSFSKHERPLGKSSAEQDGRTLSLKQKIQNLLVENDGFTVQGVVYVHTRDGSDRRVRFEMENFCDKDVPILEKKWNALIKEDRGLIIRYELAINNLRKLPE